MLLYQAWSKYNFGMGHPRSMVSYFDITPLENFQCLWFAMHSQGLEGFPRFMVYLSF